jgi:hypothetical protein
MKAFMCEWMSQNTRTMPGRSKRTAFDLPTAYRPRSNRAAFESEKTVW